MREDYEAKHHRLEKNNWFLFARRALVRRLLSARARNEKVLEVGCSSGKLLQDFAEDGFTELFGVEVSETAVEACRAAKIPNVFLSDGKQFPFPDKTFDIVVASDVLEHISDDATALREWRRVLKPEGELLLLTPAFPFLWSDHDVVNRHFRRYTKRTLSDILHGAGFTIRRITYWNSFLFLPISAVRILLRLLPKKKNSEPKDQLHELPPVLNAFLRSLLLFENWCIGHGLNFPFGVSFVVRVSRIE